jgi:hypothetical protein
LNALTLFCIRVIIQIHQFLLKLTTHGNNLPSTVRINPCLNLREPLISLSQEVILKHIIYVFVSGVVSVGQGKGRAAWAGGQDDDIRSRRKGEMIDFIFHRIRRDHRQTTKPK